MGMCYKLRCGELVVRKGIPGFGLFVPDPFSADTDDAYFVDVLESGAVVRSEKTFNLNCVINVTPYEGDVNDTQWVAINALRVAGGCTLGSEAQGVMGMIRLRDESE